MEDKPRSPTGFLKSSQDPGLHNRGVSPRKSTPMPVHRKAVSVEIPPESDDDLDVTPGIGTIEDRPSDRILAAAAQIEAQISETEDKGVPSNPEVMNIRTSVARKKDHTASQAIVEDTGANFSAQKAEPDTPMVEIADNSKVHDERHGSVKADEIETPKARRIFEIN